MTRAKKSKSSEVGRTQHSQAMDGADYAHEASDKGSDKDPYLLPLDEFVQYALRTKLFPDPERRLSPLFEFTRWMRGRKELGTDAYSAAKVIDECFKRIEGVADVVWEDMFPDLLTDDPRAEFIDTWGKITTPANMDVLQVAFRNALKVPLHPRLAMSSKYCELISIAGHLQRSRPAQPIALPVERLGNLLGVDRKFIGKYLKFATDAELLRRTSDYVPHRRAAEFIFATERFNWITGDQIN